MEYAQHIGIALLLILALFTLIKVQKNTSSTEAEDQEKLKQLEIKIATMIDKSIYDELKGKHLLQEQVNQQQQDTIKKHEQNNNELTQKNTELVTKISTLENDIKNLNQIHVGFKQEIMAVQSNYKQEFEALANKIYDNKLEKFKQSSSESLGLISTPLEKQINEFKKKVEYTYDTNNKERISLKEEIKRMNELNLGLKEEAINLTQALKGDAKKTRRLGRSST
jgi:DNA recombination protein RmuC